MFLESFIAGGSDMATNVGLQHLDGLMITAHWAGGHQLRIVI
jgi:hypothetical protein